MENTNTKENEKELSPYEVRMKSVKAQEEFCKEKGVPCFAPYDGLCFRCGSDIYNDIEYPNGYVLKGISFEHASHSMVTGCPFCHFSFCD